MMGRNRSRSCFIPGCRTGYSSKKHKKRIRCSQFCATTPEQLELWRKVIPRADKVFSSRDTVCEMHFTEDDIIRYFETTLFDGSRFRMERARPGLKKDAIPTIFPNLPEYSSNIRKLVKQMKAIQNPEENFPAVEKECHKEPAKTETESSINETDDCLEGTQNCLVETEDNVEKEAFAFDVLLKNLDSISKPNILWGVTVHDNFVMCAKWSEDHALEKRIVIDSGLNIKIFLKDVEIEYDSVVTNIEEVASLLHQVHDFQLSL